MEYLIEFWKLIEGPLTCAVSCMLTWMIAKKNQKNMQLAYKIIILEQKGNAEIVEDIDVRNGEIIKIIVHNIGNIAIDALFMKIRNKRGKSLISYGFGDTPYGYEKNGYYLK